MLINWFTTVAQILNFMLLVWLLKHFLYRPILDAIDAREKSIADKMAEADSRKAEAIREQEEFQRKNAELSERRTTLMNQAEADVMAEKSRLLEDVRKETEDMRKRHHELLRKEHGDFSREISGMVESEVFAIARKALGDLADYGLEARMGEVFLHRLGNLSPAEKAELACIFSTAGHSIIVSSAFTLPEETRKAMTEAIRKIVLVEAPVDFKTSPGIISGIEMALDGHRITWSINQYIAELQQGLASLLESRLNAGALQK